MVCAVCVLGISCIQFDDTRIVSGSWDKTIKASCSIVVVKQLLFFFFFFFLWWLWHNTAHCDFIVLVMVRV